MKRRDLLRTVSTACIVGSTAVGTGTATRERLPRPEQRADSRDCQDVAGDAVSLRNIGCEMDPARPATRVGGNLPAEFRGPDANAFHRLGPYKPVDPQDWNDTQDQTTLNDDRETTVKEHARDLGMAHREDKGILELHRYASGGGDPSVREVARRHREGHEFKLLIFNAGLFEFAGSGTQHLDIDQRKHEIGTMLKREGYDVAGLCEVWLPDHEEAITDNAGDVDSRWKSNDGFLATNNGLLTLVSNDSPGPNATIESSALGEFDPEDAEGLDANVRKGFLHTEIDLKHGCVDLFVTHLNHRWEEERYPEARQAQIDTLLEQMDQITEDGNVTIVGGDFNVLGNRVEYDEMVRKMDERRQLQDVWLTRGGAVANTSWFASHFYWNGDGFEKPGEDGEQSWPDDSDEPDWPWVCEKYHEGCHCEPYQQTRRVSRYDDDPTVRIDKNARLDYVFLEEPKPSHDFHVDVKRVRRKLFPRIPQGASGQGQNEQDAIDCATTMADCPEDTSCDFEQYLSDHMGLELELVVSPA